MKAELKSDPFTLESLIAWLEKQNPQTEYDYCDPLNCALCQYFRAHGFKNPRITMNLLAHDGGSVEFPRAFHWDIANPPDTFGISTFGAALERACKLAAQ